MVGVGRPADLNTGRMSIIGNHSAMTKGKKAVYERTRTIGGHIDTVFRDRLQRSVRRRSRMPVELTLYATGPFDNGISSNGIIERSDDDISAGCPCNFDRSIEVSHKIPCPFHAKRIWYGGLEAAHGYG